MSFSVIYYWVQKIFGEYCLDILLQKDLALHLYHDKKHNDSYYSAREENYRIFRDKYKNAISDECHYDTTLLLSFIQRCIDRGMIFEIIAYTLIINLAM